MKKLLLTALGMALIPTLVYGAPKECSYSPLQKVILSARTENDIQKLLDDRVNLNIKPKCGGNVIQLATLRGNPDVFRKLIEDTNLPLDIKVPNVDYPIANAPKEIPLGFFIAYYAPRADMMKLFWDTGTNLMGTDEKGETILWYLEQNPVLRNTDLADEITHQLLVSSATNENARKDDNDTRTGGNSDNRRSRDNAQNNNNPKPQGKAQQGSLIDAEPDNPYRGSGEDF